MLNAGLVQFSRRGPEPARCFLAWMIQIKAFGMISGRFLSYRAGSLVLLRLAGCPSLLGTPEPPSVKRSRPWSAASFISGAGPKPRAPSIGTSSLHVGYPWDLGRNC